VDNVDGPVAVVCSPASGAAFPLGSTVVGCSATDAAGNTATGSFTVSVRDTTPPVITDVPPAIAAFATTRSGAFVGYPLPKAADAVSGTVAVHCTPGPSTLFPPGTTTVACSAADAVGNSSSAGFDVSVTFSAPSGAAFFLEPDRDGEVFQVGEPVLVRFRLTGPSASIEDLHPTLLVAPVIGGVVGAYQEAKPVAGKGNVFRFKRGPRWYELLMSTRTLFRGTWQLKVDLGDGVAHTLRIVLRHHHDHRHHHARDDRR